MYGLDSILGNFVTSAATPAIGGLAGEAIGSGIQDELLKELTQTTVGALAGAGVGAGLGALTGGKAGAMGGALSGGVGGGLGGWNAKEIAGIFGSQPSAIPSPGGEPSITDQMWKQNLAQRTQSPIEKASLGAVSPGAVGLGSVDNASVFNTTAAQPTNQPVNVPTSIPTAPTQPNALRGYTDFLKQNFEPLAMGMFGGTGLTTMNQYNQSAEQYKRQQQLAQLREQQNALNFARSVYGYADGGAVNIGMANPQISVRIPAYAQDQIERGGGLAALQPGLNTGMATGGYVNTQPFESHDFYPQSRIPSAQPYAAAGNTRVLDTLSDGASFAHGGLLEGSGDGMSDSIPARVSGREEVRVADGEYVIPKHIAQKIGPEKLHKAMTEIRKSAHAKHGQQLIQDAGKRAFIKTLTGVRA